MSVSILEHSEAKSNTMEFLLNLILTLFFFVMGVLAASLFLVHSCRFSLCYDCRVFVAIDVLLPQTNQQN